MPETPDFARIARMLRSAVVVATHARPREVAEAAIQTELRKIWNARGAADLAIIDEVLNRKPPDILAQIRGLDR